MNNEQKSIKESSSIGYPTFLNQACDYFYDSAQRSILCMDVLRKQGNIFKEHIENGLPPVLIFDYEVILDGKDLDRPCNYTLLHIIDRRKGSETSPGASDYTKKRKYFEYREKPSDDHKRRPIIIIDPRAGHGPGIGGSKMSSEIGLALDTNHTVYFISFGPYPVPGQTLSDVNNAEIKFIEAVIERHPDSEKPIVIGNCQAGWAAGIIGAEHPDLVSAVIMNGAPLSYWAGRNGKNPMRYRGGLLGGVWLISLLGDLGNGIFDGAFLVAGFEDLNPANTLWKKMYNLYSKVDTEEKRYLAFERWWNGYFYMTSDEIYFIVKNLFLGNELESGGIEFDKRKPVDLTHLNCPVLVFASDGDNITPPQQALNWIVKVWDSAEHLKNQGHVVVYLKHESIGHLGIFVSGNVAEKEHRAIIRTIGMLDYLEPGLYEMIIDDSVKKGVFDKSHVRFEDRTFDDILNMDDGFEDEEDFYSVEEVSDICDQYYRGYIAPWVKTFSNEITAKTLRALHPLRIPRYIYSDMNPYLTPVKSFAPLIKENRKPVKKDNIFLQMETVFSNSMSIMLDYYKEMRDLSQETMFKFVYGNDFAKLVASPLSLNRKKHMEMAHDADNQKEMVMAESDLRMNSFTDGGFPEGAIRIMMAVAHADKAIDTAEFETAVKLSLKDTNLHKLSPEEFKRIVKQQARLLQLDRERALNSLSKILKTKKEKTDALKMGRQIAGADSADPEKKDELLQKIKKILKQ